EGGVQDWLTQTKRANEIAKNNGKNGTQPFNYGREQLSKVKSSAGQSEAAAPAIPAMAAPAKARKLGFKEQRELDGLPNLIAALEAEQAEVNALLADGSLYAIDNARALKLATRTAQIDDELLAALERWELLGG
ncbi:MAG: ABC transporter C-terminal domain-containing protein, partial [Methylococcales bacterium]|nr:ABC transporter C-terminal domain-containing protein [Methylococcales bacterium]